MKLNKTIIQKLTEVQQLHPKATVKFLVSEDTSFHDFNALYIDECDCSVRVEELTEYKDKLLDLDDLKDNLEDDILYDDIIDLTDGEYESLLEDRAFEYVFKEYIIVKLGD